MTNAKCDLHNPNYQFLYCPSYTAAVLFAVLFSFTTTGHVYQAYMFRKPFALVLIMGGLWEVVGFAVRTIAVHHPTTPGLYTGQMMLILLAPLWINAFIYMLVGRMIHFFLDDDRIFGIRARRITSILVIFDFTAFIVQASGGSMTASTVRKTALTGLHVYTAGVALQLIYNIIFLSIVVRFQMAMTMQSRYSRPSEQSLPLDSRAPNESAQPRQHSFPDCIFLLRLVYVVIALILFRNFYRLAEFASGLGSTIVKHEWYAYVFDAVPMFSALVILNIWHPGTKLQGPKCDFSEEDRARKLAKKERKAAQGGRSYGERFSKLPFVSSAEVSDTNSV